MGSAVSSLSGGVMNRLKFRLVSALTTLSVLAVVAGNTKSW
jgi:hypothetical protein